jgi:hypothetical protein
MATNVRNIIVGAAQLWLSTAVSTNGTPAATYPTLPTGASLTSAKTYLEGATSLWKDVGFTSAGLELSYEPDFGEITVDQSLDAARLFKQAQKVMIKTEFAEASLENLFIVMNQVASTLTGTAVSSTTGSTGSSANQTLEVVGGSLGDYPVERSLVAVGQAPRVSAGALNSERVYYGARVMSIDTSAHGLMRDSGTFFPVNFRLLPDGSTSNNSYGRIVDRTYS